MNSKPKQLVKSFIPKGIFRALQPVYHGLVANLAAQKYGNPASKMHMIGVTGTAGKSTTVMMLSHILNANGKKAGFITTAGYSTGNGFAINEHGLSMPGGELLQKQLADMVENGCQYAVVECTSEGLAQNRHYGIPFETALFTNLSPAHLDAHGSFENYRAAKGRLFEVVAKNKKRKTLIGANLDDPNKNYFLSFDSGSKFGVSTRTDTVKTDEVNLLQAENINVQNKISFSVENVPFDLQILGSFNITNALLAIGTARYYGVTLQECARALNAFGKVPGRMEVIENTKELTVIVDYAPEPAAMRASLQTAQLIPHRKLIHVFGSTGGHRDVSKRFEFGEISAQYADTIIITNDDVYDSSPEEIAQNIREGIERCENRKADTIETVLDRKTALDYAIKIAEPNDLILVNGKGSESFLVLPNNKRIEWDDREQLKETLANK